MRISARLFWGLATASCLLLTFNVCNTILAIGGGAYETNPVTRAIINVHPALAFLSPVMVAAVFYLVRRFLTKTVSIACVAIMFGIIAVDTIANALEML